MTIKSLFWATRNRVRSEVTRCLSFFERAQQQGQMGTEVNAWYTTSGKLRLQGVYDRVHGWGSPNAMAGDLAGAHRELLSIIQEVQRHSGVHLLDTTDNLGFARAALYRAMGDIEEILATDHASWNLREQDWYDGDAAPTSTSGGL